ncbi:MULTISPECIES: carbohydrate-binding domain-containing protein [unclassified Methylobacterium]|uniref:carbohydrate-binding domain-containing protein n=1 Tax=unclassified Methylobacterium TaxID=2615210 RepID=UPI00226A1243|nr:MULTISPECIES: carbohydrate-binding domain-containing protein [unclassified Methylobacterium]
MNAQSAVRVADVIGKVGVNSHINYTDGQYANINQDLSDIQYLGLTNLRDAAPNPALAGQDNLAAAALAGMKFDFIVQGSLNPVDAVKQIHAFVVAHPGSVTAIEGPNEVNNFPVTYHGVTGTAAAQAYQQDLYAAVKADPILKTIPVLSFTDFPISKTVSDFNNIHLYNKIGGQPRSDISGGDADAVAADPGKPVAITELGYQTSIPAGVAINWEGVDEAAQAKLIVNSVLDAGQLGSNKIYLYQLLDAYSDPQNTNIENHFGLFRLDNTPKHAATALHNLTSILSDPGSDASHFSPGGLAYSLSGMPSSAYSLLTQKSDSSYQIVLWNEPDIWNEQAHRSMPTASSPITIQLDQVFSTIQIYDPVNGSTPVQTLHNVSSVSLAMADHPFIIQVSGVAASGTGASSAGSGAAVATTVGTGSDKLVLKLSEDAYKGDAQYTVSVDGQQVGGTLTAHAAHVAGSTALDDTLTVQGNFGAGPHTVSLNFLNDAYDGPGNDRNLYVDAASYNGAAVANSSLTFLNPGPQQFTVPGTAASTGGGTPGASTSAVMKTGAAATAPAAPTVALTHDTGTGGTHVSSDGLITYAPSVSGDTLHYKLDTGAFTTTAPVLATDGSTDGQHTVTVYETNAAGLTSIEASLVFSLETHHGSNGFHLT